MDKKTTTEKQVENAGMIPEGLPDPDDLDWAAAKAVAESIGSDEDLRIFLKHEARGKARPPVIDAAKQRRWELRETTYAVIDHTKYRLVSNDGVHDSQIWRGNDEDWARQLATERPEYEVVEIAPSPGSPPDVDPAERIRREIEEICA